MALIAILRSTGRLLAGPEVWRLLSSGTSLSSLHLSLIGESCSIFPPLAVCYCYLMPRCTELCTRLQDYRLFMLLQGWQQQHLGLFCCPNRCLSRTPRHGRVTDEQLDLGRALCGSLLASAVLQFWERLTEITRLHVKSV